jgi:hypothetical protein
MAKKRGRGSDKLASRLDVKNAKALQSAISKWKVTDWHELGTPTPEMVRGAISGSPGRLGTVVGKLAQIKEIRNINILIHGIPRPDLAQVRFELRAGR